MKTKNHSAAVLLLASVGAMVWSLLPKRQTKQKREAEPEPTPEPAKTSLRATCFGLLMLLVLFLMLVVIWFMTWEAYNTEQKMEEIREHGRTTQGEVTSAYCSKKTSANYRYVVQERTYEGWGFTPGRCHQVGDLIPVYYLPEKPTVSYPVGHPAGWLDIIGWACMSVCMTLAVPAWLLTTGTKG